MLATPAIRLPFGIIHGVAWLPKPALPIPTDRRSPDAGNPDLPGADPS